MHLWVVSMRRLSKCIRTVRSFARLGVLTVAAVAVQLGVSPPAAGQYLDRLDRAPFYRTLSSAAEALGREATVGRIQVDPEMRDAFFYRDRVPVLEQLAETMNERLEELLVEPPADLPDAESGGPRGYLGSSEGETAVPGAEMLRTEGDKYPPMAIAGSRPTSAWVAATRTRTDDRPVVVLWIGFSEYPKADRGVFGKKVVLGTRHENRIRFLSAEDEPVEVLHLTGVLLDASGRILRIGGEAITHEDTPFWAQSLGISRSVDDAAVESVAREIRREDLPGRPVAWEVAAEELVTQLTGRRDLFAGRSSDG